MNIRLPDSEQAGDMHRSVSNSAYAVIEYIALPVLLVLSAPYLIHRLGPQQFGVWMLVAAIIGGMGTLSAGFGAATIKYVASSRGKGDALGVERAVRSTLSINLLMGLLMGAGVWLGAPAGAHHFFKIETSLQSAALVSMRIGAIVIVIRSVEGVFVSTLRAFECYAPAVLLNVAGRAVTIIVAVLLASRGAGIVGLMRATLIVAALETLLQGVSVHHIAGAISLLPSISNIGSELLSYGCLSWVQAFAAVVFGYADRLVVGALLGTTAVGYYSVCVQATQPIHGFAAAGFNFLFPHLSFSTERETLPQTRRLIRKAIFLNVIVAFALALPVVIFGKMILKIWLGTAFPKETPLLLPLLAISFGALALNVVPYYALLAMGHIRLVTILNLLGGAATIVTATLLTPVIGLSGAAVGRLLYGPITWISYLRLQKLIAPASFETDSVQKFESGHAWAVPMKTSTVSAQASED